MALWNNRDLPFPPISTYKALHNDIDVKHFYNVCQEAKVFFVDNQYMQAEFLVLSRIIYRMKQKFRSSKDFKIMEKVCKSLKSFFDMKFVKHLDTLIDLIPKRYKKETYLPSKNLLDFKRYKKDTYLPSKNLLDFTLVKLQGVSKLLEKVVENCKEAASLLYTRIKIGHFWKVAFIAYSIISRIHILAKYNTNKICEFYGKLFPFSNKLQCTSQWLPLDYHLPIDLKEWLDVDWLDFDEDIQLVDIYTELADIKPLFDLVDDDDIEFCDEYILINDKIEKDQTKSQLKPSFKKDYSGNIVGIGINDKQENQQSKFELKDSLRGFKIDDDIGEIIELDDSIISISSNHTNNKKCNKAKKKRKKQNAATGIGEIVEITDTSFNNTESSESEDIMEVVEVSDTSTVNENLKLKRKKPFKTDKIRNKFKKKKHNQNKNNIEINNNISFTKKTKPNNKKALKLQNKNIVVIETPNILKKKKKNNFQPNKLNRLKNKSKNVKSFSENVLQINKKKFKKNKKK